MSDDIHTILGDVREKLGHMDGKLDALLGQELEKRVRSLEKSRSWWTGALATVSGVAAAVGSIAGILTSHWSFKF